MTLVYVALAVGVAGCRHPSITAVSLAPHYCQHPLGHAFCVKEPEGIPFYLPKPMLIVAKNFRSIEEAKTGLTDSAPIPNYFDDQAKYADLNARTNFVGLNGAEVTSGGDPPGPSSPGAPAGTAVASTSKPTLYSPGGPPITPSAGQLPQELIGPETFYTYQIVFVPDMSQKYGLKVKGGAGEIRAAMNLVNGWMFTGLGPYYMKDSSTSQNTLSSGIAANLAASGVADVITSLSKLKPQVPGTEGESQTVDAGDLRRVVTQLEELRPFAQPVCLPEYAEIHVYEPSLMPDGSMDWREIVNHQFNRDVLGIVYRDTIISPAAPAPAAAAAQAATAAAQAAAARGDAAPPAPVAPAEGTRAASAPAADAPNSAESPSETDPADTEESPGTQDPPSDGGPGEDAIIDDEIPVVRPPGGLGHRSDAGSGGPDGVRRTSFTATDALTSPMDPFAQVPLDLPALPGPSVPTIVPAPVIPTVPRASGQLNLIGPPGDVHQRAQRLAAQLAITPPSTGVQQGPPADTNTEKTHTEKTDPENITVPQGAAPGAGIGNQLINHIYPAPPVAESAFAAHEPHHRFRIPLPFFHHKEREQRRPRVYQYVDEREGATLDELRTFVPPAPASTFVPPAVAPAPAVATSGTISPGLVPQGREPLEADRPGGSR
ncbi:hypothetical protein [Tautonia plasticadhaerens]|nr:hypothetical protein [Tautonia plasticadhaerens]